MGELKGNKPDFVIQCPPITKKNSQRLIRNRSGQVIPLPSKAYTEYEAAAGWFLKPLGIDYPVNIKALYYMPTRRKVDKTNLESALCDILVKHGVVTDDNSRIIAGTDGSRVLYDKDNPRTEIYITPMQDENV